MERTPDKVSTGGRRKPVSKRFYWNTRLKNPLHVLKGLVSGQLRSHRQDAERTSLRRNKKVRTREQEERALRPQDLPETGLVTTAAVAEGQDAADRLTALVQAAEASGRGLTDRELAVHERRKEGKRYRAIASDLGMSERTARSTNFRARKKIRRAADQPL